MQPHAGAPVEARGGCDPLAWLEGQVRDVTVDGSPQRDIIVRFAVGGEVWDRHVEASEVRYSPSKSSSPARRGPSNAAALEALAASPSEAGSVVRVEVFSPATAMQPASWAGAIARRVRGNFVYVSTAGGSRSQDAVVHRDRVRPVSSESTLEGVEDWQREVVQVPAVLREWIQTPDAEGCLNEVRRRTGLLSIFVDFHEGGGDEAAPQIVLVGDEETVDVGRKLLQQVHLKHRLDIHLLEEEASKLEDKQHMSSDACVSFGIDDDLVGLLLGKHGQNKRQAEESFGVAITVIKAPLPGEPHSRSTIEIRGPSHEAVETARQRLEFSRIFLPIKADHIGWVLGKRFKNLQAATSRAGLVMSKWHADGNLLELCGNEDALEAARTLLRAHMDEQEDTDEAAAGELTNCKERETAAQSRSEAPQHDSAVAPPDDGDRRRVMQQERRNFPAGASAESWICTGGMWRGRGVAGGRGGRGGRARPRREARAGEERDVHEEPEMTEGGDEEQEPETHDDIQVWLSRRHAWRLQSTIGGRREPSDAPRRMEDKQPQPQQQGGGGGSYGGTDLPSKGFQRGGGRQAGGGGRGVVARRYRAE